MVAATLLEIVERLGDVDDDLVIHAAKPSSMESSAVSFPIAPFQPGVPDALDRDGLSYFIEVFFAREFLEDWDTALQLRPSARARCERLIRYATDDA
ncbi:MAG: hypothetical protein K8S98_15595 [Planctomycetes bacterium]|nr:hypothetical protein [Planctomycetota bacterium]